MPNKPVPVSALVVVVNETNRLLKKIYIGQCADTTTFREFTKNLRILNKILSTEEIWDQAQTILGTRKRVVIVEPEIVYIWNEYTGTQKFTNLRQGDDYYLYRILFENQFNELNPLLDWGDKMSRETVVIR